MGKKTTKAFRSVIFIISTILLLYGINSTIKGFFPSNINSRLSFAVIFLGSNGIGILLSSSMALFLFEKHDTFVSRFLGTSPLKSVFLVTVPVVLSILFGSHNALGANPHLIGAIMGGSVIFLCTASEMGLRGYLTEELRKMNPYLRPLLVGGVWFLMIMTIFIPYFGLKTPHFLELKPSRLVGLIVLLFIITLIFSWFLDQAVERTKSIFVSVGLVAPFYFFILNGITGNSLGSTGLCTLFLVGSILGFVVVGTWKKRAVPRTNYATPISELTYLRTVRRRQRTRTGQTRYVNKTFELNYDPTVKDTRGRVMAKFVDWGFFIIGGFVLYGAIQRDFLDDYELFAVGFLLMIAMNPLSENFFGNTIGKYIFGLKVIDDFGNRPSPERSYKRNLLSAVAIFPLMRFFPGGGPVINRHNRLSHTFVVKSERIPEIVEKLNQANIGTEKKRNEQVESKKEGV